MRIGIFVYRFPNITQTFVLNQITGLLDKEYDLQIFARQGANKNITHSTISEYNLHDRTTYLPKVESYRDGIKMIGGSLPELLTDSHRRKLLRTGKMAPQNLTTYDALTQLGEFDIYHAHFGTVAEFARPVVSRFNSPFVASFYGVDASRLLQENPSRFNDVFATADAVTVLSEDMADQLIGFGCPETKIKKIPLPVDTSKFKFKERTAPQRGPVKIITVARFVEKKGLKYAINAVANLVEEYDIEYRIIGDGPLRDDIESEIESLGIESDVKLLGWQEQQAVQEHFHDAHIFLLSSVTTEAGDKEGTPTVLLEAQASGIPVISTKHAGIPEIVADGESGILVSERDASGLTGAITQLLNDPTRWREMGSAGRSLVEANNSIPVVTKHIHRLYTKLAGS